MIGIVGDVNLTDGYFDTGFGVGSAVAAGADPFAGINRKEGDIWIGNFEGVTARVSSKKGIYGKQFIVSPEYLAGITHFDFYNIANNHTMQHGRVAFDEMLGHLTSFGSCYFGTCKRRSVEFVYKGKRFAITGFSQRKENFEKNPLYWYNPEYVEIEAELAKYAHLDFKIAYVHWGNEFIDRPYVDQIHFAHFLIDIGYDLVVGMHPHLLQGYEIYQGKYIFYSIGNFVFNMHWEPLRYAAIVKLDVEEEKIVTDVDYVYIGDDYFPIIIAEEDVPAAYRFSYLNTLIGHHMSNEEYDSLLRERVRRYRKDNRMIILKNITKFKFSYVCAIVKDFAKRGIRCRRV